MSNLAFCWLMLNRSVIGWPTTDWRLEHDVFADVCLCVCLRVRIHLLMLFAVSSFLVIGLCLSSNKYFHHVYVFILPCILYLLLCPFFSTQSGFLSIQCPFISSRKWKIDTKGSEITGTFISSRIIGISITIIVIIIIKLQSLSSPSLSHRCYHHHHLDWQGFSLNQEGWSLVRHENCKERFAIFLSWFICAWVLRE